MSIVPRRWDANLELQSSSYLDSLSHCIIYLYTFLTCLGTSSPPIVLCSELTADWQKEQSPDLKLIFLAPFFGEKGNTVVNYNCGLTPFSGFA